MKVSLYECFECKVKGEDIYCAKGHHLGSKQNGKVGLIRLARGDSLIFTFCQSCSDFDRMGDPIAPQERGWLKQ